MELVPILLCFDLKLIHIIALFDVKIARSISTNVNNYCEMNFARYFLYFYGTCSNSLDLFIVASGILYPIAPDKRQGIPSGKDLMHGKETQPFTISRGRPGVAPSTVSRVLSGHQNVSAKTRAKVEADRTHANNFSTWQSLRRQQVSLAQQTFAVIIPETSGQYWGRILSAANREAKRLGLSNDAVSACSTAKITI